MHKFLIDPALANSDEEPRTITVLHDEGHPRITLSHRHARGQLLGASRGLITVGVDGKKWLVPASHSIWLPPHVAHDLTSHGTFSGWSVYVAASQCHFLPTAPCMLRSNALLREALSRAGSWKGLDRVDERACLEGVILGEICTMPQDNLALPMPTERGTLRVAEMCLNNLADKRSAEAWAREAAMSARTFHRHFACETGFSFVAWRQRARLIRALEMLADRWQVTRIAVELGYESPSAFVEMFRRHFGVTPAKYFDDSGPKTR